MAVILALAHLTRISGARSCASTGKPDMATGLIESLALLGAAVGGLSAYMIYLHWLTGDALAFSHIQIAWGRDFENPLGRLFAGLMQSDLGSFASSTSRSQEFLALGGLVAFLVIIMMALSGWLEEAVMLLATLLLALSTGLESVPRYIFCNPLADLFIAATLGRLPVTLLGGAVLGALALWDVLHPRVSSGYFHRFVARDADCPNARSFEVDATQLPFRLDVSRLGPLLAAQNACYVGWNNPEQQQVWTSRPQATLLLGLPQVGRRLHLSASVALFNPGHRANRFVLLADGKQDIVIRTCPMTDSWSSRSISQRKKIRSPWCSGPTSSRRGMPWRSARIAVSSACSFGI